LKKKIKLFLVIFMANISFASAALPPLYQSTNDLADIANLLSELGDSGMMVRSVDLINFTATMDSGGKICQISFKRKVFRRPPGWAGPAEKLEIDLNNCK
jgi:hypothetical protein